MILPMNLPTNLAKDSEGFKPEALTTVSFEPEILKATLSKPAILGSEDVQTKQSAQLQPKNPMHGLTLEAILISLVNHYGWPELSILIPVNCFSHDPSIKSSLKFLRKTPWARDKVEQLYAFMLRDIKRNSV